MTEPTLGVAESAPATELPFDLASAPSVSFDDVLRLREAVYADEATRRRFSGDVDRMEDAGSGTVSDRMWRKGSGLYILGRYADAAEALKKVRGSLDAAHLLGRALVRAGRAAEGLTVLEDAVREKPTDARIRAALLEAVDATGDVEAVRRAVKNPPKSFEDTADFCFFEGRLAEAEMRHMDAVGAFERGLERDGNHRGCLFHLARNLDLRGMDEEAIGLYERLVRLKPIDAAAVLNLGVLYEDRADYVRALGCYEAVLKVDPAHARARLYREDARASISMYYDEDEEKKEDKLNQILKTPISDFELSVRARNCLQKMDIQSLGDLVRKTEAELLAYKNFGETSLNEIKEMLTVKGLRLGMLRAEVEADAIRRMEAEAHERSRELDDDMDEAKLAEVEAEEEAEEARADALARPVGDLQLSVRSRRAIDALGLATIGDLAAKKEADLANLPNFGPTSLQEVKDRLKDLGLALAG